MDGGTDSRRAVRRGLLEGQPSTPSDSGQGPSAFYAVSRKRRGASRAPKCMRFPWTAAHALRTRGPAPGPASGPAPGPAQAAHSRTPRAPVLWPGFGRSSPAPPVAPPLEGSTSSRPVRQPRPPPSTVPPAPDPCAQAWRWHLSSASGASSAHLPTCRGSGGTVCPECLRSCPWAQ